MLSKDADKSNYYVTETLPDGTPLKGYAAVDDKLFVDHFGFVGLDNTYQYTTYTVNKQWDNNSGTGNPASATVHLQESIDGGKTFFDYTGDGTATLTEKGGWSYQWTNLPSYIYTSGSPVPVVYQTYEDRLDDYTTSYGTVNGNAENGYSQTITNTSKYTTFKVSKIWNHGVQSESDWPDSVTVTLLANGESVYSGLLNADNNWMGTFYDMPIVDDNGTAISYTVEEFDVDGYTKNAGQITGSSADGYQIEFTNTHNDPATPTPSGDDDYVPPDTGDHTNTLPWGIALGVSLAAIIAAVIYRKRSE